MKICSSDLQQLIRRNSSKNLYYISSIPEFNEVLTFLKITLTTKFLFLFELDY